MFAIINKELRSFFSSMLGYAIIAFYMIVLGIYFVMINCLQQLGHIEYTLSSISFMFIVLIPILTMKSLADERKNKSDDECSVKLAVIYSFYCIEIEGEHSRYECYCIVKTLYSEEHPSNYCQNECYHHARYFSYFFVEFL